jgi:hypothetical protein
MQPVLCSKPNPFFAKTRIAAPLFWRLGVLLLFALPLTAAATLGEVSTSTEADRASMKASIRTVPATNYTVHQIQAPSGTTVREYVSQDGMVFAVAWQGPLMPDLRQTLGRYFDRYTAAASEKRAGRRQVAVRDSDLVVQSSGHMRSFSGRAYLPQLLPQGVTLEELR